MKTWALISLGVLTACMIKFLILGNYEAASGWLCAALLQSKFILGELK